MVMKSRTFDELLDEHEYAIGLPIGKVSTLGDESDPFDRQLPVFQIADSWGSSEDTPMGLDLRKIG